MTGKLEEYLRKQEQPEYLLPKINGKTIMINSLEYYLEHGCHFNELRKCYDHSRSLLKMLRNARI